jgi:hypothetical protein
MSRSAEVRRHRELRRGSPAFHSSFDIEPNCTTHNGQGCVSAISFFLALVFAGYSSHGNTKSLRFRIYPQVIKVLLAQLFHYAPSQLQRRYQFVISHPAVFEL